ncbi:S1 family peptidase [Corynebacterium sp. Marseille-P4321]|uniref:S1 family peptidase n=1 Tax=Corynebacterium sp. Marseille-P4321 TaxID=2736603 RepID=UPI0015896D0A|nr:S1 family peptidase [Corynebacterium sp. Marseille-P4321]
MRRLSTAVAATVTAIAVAAGIPAAHAEPQHNYVWRNDPVSKTLAGKPFADRVLHRVPGSLHDAPRVPADAAAAAARGNALYGPGTPIYVGQDAMCTVTVAGYNDRGQKIALTAGHCGNVGDPVVSADAQHLGRTGTVTQVNREFDYAVITLAPNTEVSRSYGGVTAGRVGGAPVQPGTRVCKSGVASGTTCGITFRDWQTMNINHVCAMQGDSGAPLMAGDRVVGLVNGGVLRPPLDLACHSPLQGVVHAPTGAVRMDTVLSHMSGGFRLP